MRHSLLAITIATVLAIAGCASEPGLPYAVAPPPPPLEETAEAGAPHAAGTSAVAPVAGPATSATGHSIAPHIAAAIADSHRPTAERARDVQRKPAEVLAFAGIAPGQRVADLIPGGGYFTRLFAKAVGDGGKVYAVAPANPDGNSMPEVLAVAADPAHTNIAVVRFDGPLALPEPVDVIFTAQNYHDLHLPRLRLDVPAMNKAFFAALKPGGVLVVVDHSAIAGSGLDVPDVLHRIDESIVVREVTAAGFVLDGTSDVLRNPDDPRNVGVFDPAIRGNTDQFVLRFRKP
jgi:predicted methyltransferase